MSSLTVHLGEAVVAETGLWCDNCLLPSTVKVSMPVYTLRETGVRCIGHMIAGVCSACSTTRTPW